MRNLLFLLLMGCSTPQMETSLYFQAADTPFYPTKEIGLYCEGLNPVKLVANTNYGVIEMPVYEIEGGFKSDNLRMKSGDYTVFSLVLVDETGTITHKIPEKKEGLTVVTVPFHFQLSEGESKMFGGQVSCIKMN